MTLSALLTDATKRIVVKIDETLGAWYSSVPQEAQLVTGCSCQTCKRLDLTRCLRSTKKYCQRLLDGENPDTLLERCSLLKMLCECDSNDCMKIVDAYCTVIDTRQQAIKRSREIHGAIHIALQVIEEIRTKLVDLVAPGALSVTGCPCRACEGLEFIRYLTVKQKAFKALLRGTKFNAHLDHHPLLRNLLECSGDGWRDVVDRFCDDLDERHQEIKTRNEPSEAVHRVLTKRNRILGPDVEAYYAPELRADGSTPLSWKNRYAFSTAYFVAWQQKDENGKHIIAARLSFFEDGAAFLQTLRERFDGASYVKP